MSGDQELISEELLTVEQAAKILGVPPALVVRRMEDGRLPWLRVCRRDDVIRLKAAEDEQTAALRALARDDEVDYAPGPEALYMRGGKRERADITWTRLHIAPPEAEDMRLREILIDEIMARQPTSGLEELCLWQLLHSLVSLGTAITLTLSRGTTMLTVRRNR
jgi:hypothetical protein